MKFIKLSIILLVLTVSFTHGQENDIMKNAIQKMRVRTSKIEISVPDFSNTKIEKKSTATLTDKTCRQNMTYTECGDCEKTCLNGEMACTKMCRPPGCYCNPGYFINEQGNCVLERDCLNGNHDDKPSQSKSVMTGKTLRKNLPKYKNLTIPTKECKKNEIWDECGKHCEPTCKQRDKTCFLVCGPGACVCIGGFLKNSDGVCVPIEECPK